MGHGNPNQKRLLSELSSQGLYTKVKRNQIHIEGIKASPYYPQDKIEDGQTIGLTMAEARFVLLLKNNPEMNYCINCDFKTKNIMKFSVDECPNSLQHNFVNWEMVN
jgi:hypothetical protein